MIYSFQKFLNESIEIESLIDMFQNLELDFDTVDVSVEKLDVVNLYTIKISFSDGVIPNNFGTRLMGYINRAEGVSHTIFSHLTLHGRFPLDVRNNYIGRKQYLARRLDNDYQNDIIKYIKITIIHES